MLKRRDKNQKKLGNKGFSLVELIVVIAIMAVLVGILAPTLIGNIEKSRESKDLNNLDNVYAAVKTAYGDEGGYSAANATTDIGTGVKLSTLVADTNAFTKQIKEALGGSAPTLVSKAAKGTNGTIYVKINSGKITVLIAEDGTPATALKADKIMESSGTGKEFLVD